MNRSRAEGPRDQAQKHSEYRRGAVYPIRNIEVLARHLVMELKLNSLLSQQRIRRTRRISTNKKMGKVGTMLSGTKTTEKAEVLVAFLLWYLVAQFALQPFRSSLSLLREDSSLEKNNRHNLQHYKF